MNEITNPRIEKMNAQIDKTRAKIAELQAKLREQERQKKNLEDMEIVARFRSEQIGSIDALNLAKTDADLDATINTEIKKEDFNTYEAH